MGSVWNISTISVRFASAIDTIIKGKRGNQFLYFYTYAFRGVNRIAWALSSETNVGCFVLKVKRNTSVTRVPSVEIRLTPSKTSQHAKASTDV